MGRAQCMDHNKQLIFKVIKIIKRGERRKKKGLTIGKGHQLQPHYRCAAS